MALSPTILPRVGQLVRLLASPHDGEVVAAAAALRRALAAVGADLNDLGDAIERPAEREIPAPSARRGRKRNGVEIKLAWARNVVEVLGGSVSSGKLSAWEDEFSASVITILRSSRPHLSARQIEIVERLLTKCGEG